MSKLRSVQRVGAVVLTLALLVPAMPAQAAGHGLSVAGWAEAGSFLSRVGDLLVRLAGGAPLKLGPEMDPDGVTAAPGGDRPTLGEEMDPAGVAAAPGGAPLKLGPTMDPNGVTSAPGGDRLQLGEEMDPDG